MSYVFSQDDCDSLDKVLAGRRSVRSFRPEAPPREQIAAIVLAGLQAPFAALAVTDGDFRRFVVIPGDSPKMELVVGLAKQRLAKDLVLLEKQMEADPVLKMKGKGFVNRMRSMAGGSVPGIGTAPYLIVAAERKGIPPVEQQSLAHCLQNMWLKATVFNLGFHLVSFIAQMAGEKEFCDLLGIPCGEFGLNGCAVGYPNMIPGKVERPTVDEVTTWLD